MARRDWSVVQRCMLDASVKLALNSRQEPRQGGSIWLKQSHVVAAERCRLGYPEAHRATTEHTDQMPRVGAHAVIAFIPVSSRPIMSCCT